MCARLRGCLSHALAAAKFRKCRQLAPMKAYLKKSRLYPPLRFLYHQVVPEPHSRPPVLETLLYRPFSALEKARYVQGRGSTAGLVLPHFLGIGGMQSGTSWLLFYLGHHPQIYVPDVKELQYFSWRYHRSLRYYSRQFEAHADKIRGEISTEYSFLPLERIRFLRAIAPEVRLFFILRDPIDRAWSHAKQELLFRTHRKYEEVREFEFIRRFRHPNTRHYSNCLRDIDNWLSVYPREQLYVGVYDDIVRCPERLLTDVFRHIGVSTDVDFSTFPIQEVFRGGEKTPPMPAKYREVLEEMYADMIEELYRRYGEPVAHWRCKPALPEATSVPAVETQR